MRNVIIKNKQLKNAADDSYIQCWHDCTRVCSTDCVAHAVVALSQDGRSQGYACAAMPQMIPIGIPEPSRIVVPAIHGVGPVGES